METDRSSESTQPKMNSENQKLSSAQERLWFLDQIEAGSPHYNISSAFRLRGQLDRKALSSAFIQVINRHNILRSRFLSESGEPKCVIAEPIDNFNVNISEAHGNDTDNTEEWLKESIRETIRIPFDLAEDSLVRVCLFRISDNEHVFLLVIHHIIADGWSMSVIFKELSAFYDQFLTGPEISLTPQIATYDDYIDAEQKILTDADFDKDLDYWREALKDNPAQIDLPTDFARPATKSYKGDRIRFTIRQNLSNDLKKFSQNNGVTLYMTMMTAFQILLYRYTNQERTPVGIPFAKRDRPGFDSIIGLMLSTLVISPDLSGGPSFIDLLGRVRSTTLDAFKHQNIPFEKLVEAIQPERDMSRNPLFQVMFAMQNMPRLPLNLSGLAIERYDIETGFVKFDFALELMEEAEGIRGRIDYSCDLFHRETMLRFSDHYMTLLETILSSPESSISTLRIIPETEFSLLINEWSGQAGDYDTEGTIHSLFEQQVERTPDAVATCFKGETLSYSQLNQRANQIAHALIQAGVEPGATVVMPMERSFDMVAAVLGIVKVGGVYCPIDPELPVERIDYIIDDCRPAVIVTQQKFTARFDKYNIHGLEVEGIDDDGDGSNPNVSLSGDDPIYIIYTSGSTGKPKGVVNRHKSIYNRIRYQNIHFPIGGSDKSLLKTTISFDVSIIEIFWPLSNGACIYILNPGAHLDPIKLVKIIRESQLSLINLVPSLLQTISDVPKLSECKSLKWMFPGGEALPTDLARQIRQKLDLQLVNWYGPTEAAVGVLYHHVVGNEAEGIVPIGRPIHNVYIYILDSNRNLAPIGVPGELFLGGICLAKGYLNRPDLNDRQFFANPFRSGADERLYKTGDLVKYLPNGEVQFMGRVDDQVKVRGFRIELGEIEVNLAEHKHVEKAVVIARKDNVLIDQLVAFIVPASGIELDVQEIRRFLAGRLPEYMIPAAIQTISEIPLTSSGKIDRQSLAKLDVNRVAVKREFVPPRNQLDIELQLIWSKLLNVWPVGIRDNFFELGGHSLMAVKLFAEISEKSGKELPLASLFIAPTIEGLADIIRKEGWELPPQKYFTVNAGGKKPAIFLIPPAGAAGLHFVELGKHLGDDQPIVVLLPGGMEVEDVPNSRISDIAKICLDQIREIQPFGPYLVGGSCFGGYVAFEMAHQMQGAGEDVPLLMLFDVHGPGFKRKGNTLLFHLRKFREIDKQERLDYIKARIANVRKKIRNRSFHIAHTIANNTGLRLPAYFQNVKQTHLMARHTYSPTPYSGRGIIFQAEEQPEGFENYNKGWDGLFLERLDVKMSPGSHRTMMHDPNISVVARELNRALSETLKDVDPMAPA